MILPLFDTTKKSKRQLTFLFRDEFTTDRSAPLPNPLPASHVGQWSVVDTLNKLSVSSSKIQGIADEGSTYTDPMIKSTDSWAIGAGYCLLTRAYHSSAGNVSFHYGLKRTTDSDASNSLRMGINLYFQYVQAAVAAFGNTMASIVYAPSGWATYTLAMVARSTGGFFMMYSGADLKLMWVDDTTTHGTCQLKSGQHYKTLPGQIDFVRLIDLPTNGYTVWQNDSAVQLYLDTTPTSGDTATGEANGLQYMKWTVGSGETFEMSLRRTDDNNRWIIRCSQSGGTIKLIEVNAGVETERTSVAQPWTAGETYRIGAMWDAAEIWGYIHRYVTYQIALKWRYTSATFNQTATGCKVAGFASGTNWEIYPRYVTGDAKAAIDAVLNAE